MKPDFSRAQRYIFERMDRELSPRLSYHSLRHTRDDVLPAIHRLGVASGLSEESLLLLETAAVFHDAGFLHRYSRHEQESVAIAAADLPEFGYSPAQIAVITELISATCMPQTPDGPLQGLLCDADLDLLGRPDFWELNRQLLAETRAHSAEPIDEAAWLTAQLHFLERHSYFSPVARALRDEGKARNVILLRRALAHIRQGSPDSRVDDSG